MMDRQYTVHDAIEHAGFGVFQIFICGIGFLCWLCDVMELSLIGYILPVLEKEWKLSGIQKSLIASVLFVGMFFGSLFFGWLCDRFGRRVGLIINLIYTCLAAFSSVFVNNWIVFMVTRGLTGFGVAGIQISFSLVAEFLPVKTRGTALMTMSGAGVILANLLEAGMVWLIIPRHEISIGGLSIRNWRFLLIVIASPLLLVTALCPFIPESPRFDMISGNTPRAISTIQRMCRWNRVTPMEGRLVLEITNESETVLEEPDLTESQQGEEEQVLQEANTTTSTKQKSSILTLFHKEYRLITILLSIIWFVCSFTYYGVIILTPGYIISTSKGNSQYLSLFVSVLATIPGLILLVLSVNVLGRRISLALYYLLSVLFLLAMLTPIPDFALKVFVVCARLSVGNAYSSANLMTPELYPTVVRATGTGLMAGIARIAAAATPFVSNAVYDMNKGITFTAYAVLSAIGLVAVFFVPYETKGVILSDTVKSEAVIQ